MVDTLGRERPASYYSLTGMVRRPSGRVPKGDVQQNRIHARQHPPDLASRSKCHYLDNVRLPRGFHRKGEPQCAARARHFTAYVRCARTGNGMELYAAVVPRSVSCAADPNDDHRRASQENRIEESATGFLSVLSVAEDPFDRYR